ncbi:MAG: TetR/AcrR family transcriptional regulator [Saprospiraceae bacterium]|nr:TetR/AcrR family transcriptional regulator [Saprospiraceae bacterium]
MFSEQQEKWLKRAEELFFRYGIKSLTMDDVARELGISKKTLYAFVENKDDLVHKVLELHLQSEREVCGTILQNAENAIEEMFLVMESNAQQMSHMRTNIVYDLQKYHRSAWEMVEGYMKGFLYGVVKANLERGITEGLYRRDFDVDIITRLHIATTFLMFDEIIFPQQTYKREFIFQQYIQHYLYAVASEKGLKLIRAKFAQHAQQN